MKKKLDLETLSVIMTDDHKDYELISDEVIDNTRWNIINNMVFKDKSDNTYWETSYSYGATETQDEAPFEYHDGYVYQVEPIEKTIIVYERIDSPES